MNVGWLSLRDLEYVVSLAELENFGRAAKAVNVSQPALSLQIKKLEGQLGFKIFERTKRRVFSTDLGREFVQRARKVLEQARTLVELGHAESPFESSFRLGAIRTLSPYLMPLILPPFFKSYPNAKLLIREGLTDELVALLRRGDLDAVLASPTFDEIGLNKTEVFFEPFQMLFPSGHALLSKKNIQVRDLDPNEMVLLEDGHCLKDQVVDLCPANKRGSIRNFHATSLETVKQLVAAGQGYTLFPELAVAKKEMGNLLAYRPLEGREVGRLLCLYTRADYARDNEARMLATVIRKGVRGRDKIVIRDTL